MDSVLVRSIAKDLFGLNCTAAEAEEPVIPLAARYPLIPDRCATTSLISTAPGETHVRVEETQPAPNSGHIRHL